MMPVTLNFRAAMPMVGLMNAIAQASPFPVTGPKLDNRRVIAAIVDLLIVAVGAVAVLLVGDALAGDRQSALGAVVLGWALYYFFALESGEGQTVGKRLMKLRVVRADGRPAGMREIAVRTILRVVDNYLVGLIVMLATGERRQRVGDLAAGTIVVDASVLAVAPPPAPVADAAAADQAEDEPAAEADWQPVPAQTITLPARPAPPATLADLTEPEAEETVVEEPLAEAPVAEAPVAEEPEAEEPVAEEPEAEEPVAHGVAAAHPEPDVEEVEPRAEVADVEDADQAGPAEELLQEDGPLNVKSVETVSAMDLIMGAVDEDAPEEAAPESARRAEGSASE
jgi:uncharacterized RDD family membrane protein YckC